MTTTTWTFDYTGSLDTFVVPFCVQAHTSQADWTPDKVPALWTPVRKVAGAAPDEWVQPAGASDAYSKGDRVTFQGQVWESTIDANVWSPTAHSAGWKKVT